MNFDELEAAVRQARMTLSDATHITKGIAYILRGNLKKAGVDNTTLCELKKELQNYNMHTGEWTR